MKYTKDISIIIPHRNSLATLSRLFDSIPMSNNIEIILIDNGQKPLTKAEINIDREYTLGWASPNRFAGGARNIGIELAHGKWLIFADADDYFSEDAFETFFSNVNSDAELIYYCMGGIYSDTGAHSNRGDTYTTMVKEYISGIIPEVQLRIGFVSPCCKMVSHELIDRHNIQYDEVLANNDINFSLQSGYYARTIDAVDKTVYIATVSRGSLTQRYDYDTIKSRIQSTLKFNAFLKTHNLSKYQHSVMLFLSYSLNYGIGSFFEFIGLLIKYRQNPLVGWTNWFKTTIALRKSEKKYRVRY